MLSKCLKCGCNNDRGGVAGFDAVRVFDADAVVAVKNADIALGLMDDLGVGLGIDIESLSMPSALDSYSGSRRLQNREVWK